MLIQHVKSFFQILHLRLCNMGKLICNIKCIFFFFFFAFVINQIWSTVSCSKIVELGWNNYYLFQSLHKPSETTRRAAPYTSVSKNNNTNSTPNSDHKGSQWINCKLKKKIRNSHICNMNSNRSLWLRFMFITLFVLNFILSSANTEWNTHRSIFSKNITGACYIQIFVWLLDLRWQCEYGIRIIVLCCPWPHINMS